MVWQGRRPHERVWMMHAFIAKSVYGFATTEALIDALKARPTLRRLCGWEDLHQLPDRSTFSRAFSAFAEPVAATDPCGDGEIALSVQVGGAYEPGQHGHQCAGVQGPQA